MGGVGLCDATRGVNHRGPNPLCELSDLFLVIQLHPPMNLRVCISQSDFFVFVFVFKRRRSQFMEWRPCCKLGINVVLRIGASSRTGRRYGMWEIWCVVFWYTAKLCYHKIRATSRKPCPRPCNLHGKWFWQFSSNLVSTICIYIFKFFMRNILKRPINPIEGWALTLKLLVRKERANMMFLHCSKYFV